MDLGTLLATNLGLLVFTAISIVLVGYLAYSMVHPEAF